jgi:L-ascorbate metabolism protein UlaG (beta-lactamase superfamily)
MKITKFGHCCLLVEEGNLKVLTDPGIFSNPPEELNDLDLVLITHEHPDHLHIDSLKVILAHNPNVKVITTAFVEDLLKKENIASTVLEHGQSVTEKEVLIEAIGELHAQMHSSIPQSTNVGFFIANKLFYAGDALTKPGKRVEVLALPVAGPWMKISDGIDYAIELDPKFIFPVHEAIYVMQMLGHKIPQIVFDNLGKKFFVPEDGKAFEV